MKIRKTTDKYRLEYDSRVYLFSYVRAAGSRGMVWLATGSASRRFHATGRHPPGFQSQFISLSKAMDRQPQP